MKSDKKKIYAKCLDLAKKIAKTRDNYTCQYCGKTVKETAIHGSHIYNEAKDHRLAIDPDNIKALCYHHHLNRRHKMPLESFEWFVNKRPGRYETLQQKRLDNMKLGSISLTRYEEQYDQLSKQRNKMCGLDQKEENLMEIIEKLEKSSKKVTAKESQ